MSEAKKGFLPLSHGIRLSETQSPSTSDEQSRMSRISYASAIGPIMYAVIRTRPEVAFAISLTSKYQANCQAHFWDKSQKSLKSYQPQDHLVDFLDIDNQYNSITQRVEPECSMIITSLPIYYGGGIIQWCSGRQH